MGYSKFRSMYIASIVVCGIVVGLSAGAAESTKALDQYRGSFVIEQYNGAPYYWYVDPISGDRFAIKNSVDFSRLVEKLGISVDRKTIGKLPQADGSVLHPSLDLIQKYRGDILVQSDALDKIWYLNPFDLKLYYLQNGAEGFTTVQNLALDIRQERLDQIPVTTEFGYSTMNHAVVPDTASETLDTSVYGELFQMLLAQHLRKDSFTAQDLYYGSLKGMAQATGDLYTEFYPPEKNKEQEQYFNGNTSLEGIGAAIDTRDTSLYISWLVKDSPAEKSGLKAQDQITAIDGISTSGMSVDVAVSRIKGPAGTKVVLSIYRATTSQAIEYTITRERIVVPDVSGQILGNDIAYFKFSLFTTTLIPQFQRLVSTIITPSTKGIVIDMRDNIGGVTQSSARLADYWLVADQLVYTERRPGIDRNYIASGGRDLPQMPTVIVTNGETASASEIFTAALKYYHQATVIGTQTHGKGTGQNIYDFADGSGIKMTTFEWLPPDGKTIDKIGITPDIIVAPSEFGDSQLNRALQFIRSGY